MCQFNCKHLFSQLRFFRSLAFVGRVESVRYSLLGTPGSLNLVNFFSESRLFSIIVSRMR